MAHRGPRSAPPETILVLRALGLGDALTGVPALRGIRRAYPAARLILACDEQLGGWLAGMGIVDGVLPTKSMARGMTPLPHVPRPDLAVNLHGRGPQSHAVLRATDPREMVGFTCRAAGFTNGPDWDGGQHEVDRWCTLAHWMAGRCDREDLRLPRIEAAGTPAHVLVHPGAASDARRWPVERWREVIASLPSAQPVVITGTASEEAVCRAVSDALPVVCRAGHTTLTELAELVMGSRLVLSGDTGVAHLATAYGVPSVTLFGPVSPASWGPSIDPELHRVIWHDDGVTGDPHSDRIDPRLEAISVEEVCSAVADLLTAPDLLPTTG